MNPKNPLSIVVWSRTTPDRKAGGWRAWIEAPSFLMKLTGLWATEEEAEEAAEAAILELARLAGKGRLKA